MTQLNRLDSLMPLSQLSLAQGTVPETESLPLQEKTQPLPSSQGGRDRMMNWMFLTGKQNLLTQNLREEETDPYQGAEDPYFSQRKQLEQRGALNLARGLSRLTGRPKIQALAIEVICRQITKGQVGFEEQQRIKEKLQEMLGQLKTDEERFAFRDLYTSMNPYLDGPGGHNLAEDLMNTGWPEAEVPMEFFTDEEIHNIFKRKLREEEEESQKQRTIA